MARQCALLKLPRCAVYRKTKPVSERDLTLMRLLDEAHLKWPFYGVRKLVVILKRAGHTVNRKRVSRLMRVMGLQTIYRKPNLSRRHPQHKIYPYLLRNMAIERAHQVWSCDITYIPMQHGCVYLVAVMDWFSRKVLSWRLSNTMDKTFCVDALEDAFAHYGKPEIFNTDQGVQFTCEAFITALEKQNVRISMDGKGRCLDNIFCERLWRSLKYEEVYLKAYTSIKEARSGIGAWIDFYNTDRPHQSLDDLTPDAFFAMHTLEENIKKPPVDMMDNPPKKAGALPTYPQQQQQKGDSHEKEKGIRSFPNAPWIPHAAHATKVSNSLLF